MTGAYLPFCVQAVPVTTYAHLCRVLVPMIAGRGVPSLVQAAGSLVQHRAPIHMPIAQQRLLSVWQAVLAVVYL